MLQKCLLSCCIYKNNEIKPFVFPNVIEQVCKGYNHAHILTEVNDIGQQIAERYNLK